MIDWIFTAHSNYDLRMAWIDISNLNAKVPYVNGSIYIKILILKSEE